MEQHGDRREEDEETEEEEDSRQRQQTRQASRVDPTITPWARQLGVDPQKMHVMQAALFRMPEEERALKAMNEAQPSKKRLLLPSRARKHSRDSEGDGLRADSRQRASFAHDIDPEPYRPSRKYVRVESSASAFGGLENAAVDQGLYLGRSFRVGWGPGGTLVHLGDLCGPAGTSYTQAARLLTHHLAHTVIEDDADGVPFANPLPALSFASFVSQFPATDHSFEPTLFRLGHALFDSIDFRLNSIPDASVRQRIAEIRRKTELSKWLKMAVSSATDADLRGQLDAKWSTTVFTLLTGYQVGRACDATMDSGNVKLASLIAQCPGDAAFRGDLEEQLELWRTQKIDAHIDAGTRRIYALLAGIVNTLEGSHGSGLEQCPDVDLAAGLDWKRAFGLQLWFGMPMDASIAEVFREYDALWADDRASVAAPVPWYKERPAAEQSETAWTLPASAQPPDALYALIKLFADSECSLSSILSPFSFGVSPADYRLPWHLYIILSRCLRVRDLADREASGAAEGDEDVEGHSPSADLLANSYASQLEQLGMVQEAAFVLLHLESSTGRVKAIKELLTRCADKLDDWVTRGLVGSLKLPMAWINEAKAVYALDSGKVYDAYELYLAAGLYDAAHDLAVLELAPDAVIRQDLLLLRELFEVFNGRPITGWSLRGKVFFDYVAVLTRLPQLRDRILQGDGMLTEDETADLEHYARAVPKMLNILPDVLPDRSNVRHNAAVTEMTNKLVYHLDRTKPLAIAQSQVRTPFFSEATRTKSLHSTMYEKFLRTVEVA
ncbi:nuclear protein 96-domain-containing protein [Epithele typhae]|uniref:nuclear protein 96-domain-containing protein n=1 Tax=Epithele typhae TaxID=378194 RepID=UPI00200806D2|nr:nuclear protein 96-domain-containing protein [Epithele typhae]KAH9941590.1 nuclear protein 96-domain-containing protein [Epithele typhae]